MQPELIGGRYRVQSAIGQGGMGTVWLCRDEKLHRDVAVKQVGLVPGESVTDSARALREARSSAALSHRNVVTVFDVVEENGHIWLVMEHVPARSLAEIIRSEGRLSPGRVADIGAQVAAGLASAHEAGITHRDVKPGNVLVRDDGVAKISDFGIARTAGDPALTQSGIFIGTPMYFSPELARGAEPDPSADVWALGATLYAAVQGQPPYEQRTNAMAVLTEIANEPAAAPQHAGPLEPALARMLDRDPVSRWSMQDAAHALRRVADREAEGGGPAGTAMFAAADAGHPARDDRAGATEAVAAVPPAAGQAPTPMPQPQPQPTDPADRPSRRSRGVLLPLLVVVALLLVGAATYAALNHDDGAPVSAPGDTGSPSDNAKTNDDKTDAPRESKESGPDESSPAETDDPGEDTVRSPAPEETEAPPAGPGEMEPTAFVRDYYRTVPDDLDAGWSMLGPGLRSVGRDSYDGFWNSIDTVRASRLSTDPEGDSVDVTLRFTTKDGRVSVERHRIDLIRADDGGYLINGDTNLD